MRIEENRDLFFATDLTGFLACRHLTALERLAAHKLAKRPFFEDPMLDLLRERGLEHEHAYVEHLRARGRRVTAISRGPDALHQTMSAMRDGVDVIVQARLEHQRWAGWADVLLKVDGASSLGSWKYEPVETKLAKETRGATLVQLCLYAEILGVLQGAAPDSLRVVTPGKAFEAETYRFAEYRSYFNLARRNFETEIAGPLATSVESATPYPEPVQHCDVCNWFATCQRRRERDDHVSLVAGILRTQRKELATWDVTTLSQVARLPLPLQRKPSQGSVAALERVREQARLQLEARERGRPGYELLAFEEDAGLAALPPPSRLDIFLDLEGDRQAEDGGFDYLFGYACRGADGVVRYEPLWALSRDDEKRAFERLIDLIRAWRIVDPFLHVYHYAPYEPTALKRLMGRYGTRADELDDLLRAEVFVDLFSIVKRSLRAGVDSYSIKKLESLYGFTRSIDLAVASRRLRAAELAIARGDVAAIDIEMRAAVEGYNRDDCVSALALRDWLESLRREAAEAWGHTVPRPSPPEVEVNEELGEHLARIRAVSEALTNGLPTARTREQQATWLLAQLLEWHRREDKVDWWEFFRLSDMTDEELLDDVAGLAGLAFRERVETTKFGGAVDRYTFTPQDTNVEEGETVYVPGNETPSAVARVEAIDVEACLVDLRKSAGRVDVHPTAVFRHDMVRNKDAVAALLRLGEFVRDHGIDSAGDHRAARDLLLRSHPRLVGGAQLRLPGESTLASARRAALALDGGVLAVQGPPGAGKTHAGARIIVDLVRAGRRVAVTAVSHKVIRNMLEAVVRAAGDEQISIRCMHRLSEKSKNPPDGIDEITDSARAFKKIVEGEYDVVGGTAWVWSSMKVTGAVDVLVVDEAGQMSLANVLACAQSAKNLVLLGDPQQLEQPQKTSHPEGSELSALEYLLEGHDTMPEDRGLFLGESWRLHPAICAFTSDLFYESKLRPVAGLENQQVSGPVRYAGAGLFFSPVEHEGNRNVSEEEAARVTTIVTELLGGHATWTDRLGATRPLSLNDILIVAPYNAQVSEIARRLPGARVGTVDKFQGQEAPVVIYSTTTSSAEDAPHGKGFLFSRHRLNVATSRARCVVILVGNPRLYEPECRTPEQMRMASAFCAYLEHAKVR